MTYTTRSLRADVGAILLAGNVVAQTLCTYNYSHA